MVEKFGIPKLAARRIFELIKEYRSKIHSLESYKHHDWPVPPNLTYEQEEEFIDEQVAGIQIKIDRLKQKIEVTAENALERIGITSDVTVTQNRYGRIRIMAECPACHQDVDLCETIAHEGGRLGLRCTRCGATKWVN